MKFGVVVFPGTWSDTDCFHVLKDVMCQSVEYIWHKETDLSNYDCIIAVSGGKDSYYQTHIIKQYGLKPLLIITDFK